MTPTTTSTTLPPRTADSPLSSSPAGAPSPAEAPSRGAERPSARSPESASSWSTATSSRTRSLYSTETTRPARSITGAGPLLSRHHAGTMPVVDMDRLEQLPTALRRAL